MTAPEAESRELSRRESRSPESRNYGRRSRRILLAGTGGQGVLLGARLLTAFFVARGHRVVSGQMHGMAQRGGAVQSTVVIDGGSSPALRRGGADFLVGLEPVETARALPFVSARTAVLMNTAPVIPFVLSQQAVLAGSDAVYPDVEELADRIRAVTPHLQLVDATARARAAGSIRTLNMVMLGALFATGRLPGAPEDFLETVVASAPSGLADTNRRAFLAGVSLAPPAPASGKEP